MKILMVVEASGGGSGRHLIDLTRTLCADGHEVSVIYSPIRAEPALEAELARIGAKDVRRLSMTRSVGLSDFETGRRLRTLISEMGPFDVIHAHSSKAGALARLFAPSGPSRIYTPHAFRTMDPATGLLARCIYGGVEMLLGRFCSDAVICVSPDEHQHALELHLPESKLHTVINGVTPAPDVDRLAIRRSLEIAEDDIAVCFVGRMCAQKDPQRFAQMINVASRRDPRIRGVMFGDGELKVSTQEIAGPNVKILSGLNAREYLAGFDVFASTSRYEGMPYVFVEALAVGLPIITTRVGGSGVAVEDFGNGRIVDAAATADEMAATLIEMIDDASLRRMAEISRQRAAPLTAEKMMQNTLAVYRQTRRQAA